MLRLLPVFTVIACFMSWGVSVKSAAVDSTTVIHTGSTDDTTGTTGGTTGTTGGSTGGSTGTTGTTGGSTGGSTGTTKPAGSTGTTTGSPGTSGTTTNMTGSTSNMTGSTSNMTGSTGSSMITSNMTSSQPGNGTTNTSPASIGPGQSTPLPQKGGFDGASFAGGIALGVGALIIVFIAYRCYVMRQNGARSYKAM